MHDASNRLSAATRRGQDHTVQMLTTMAALWQHWQHLAALANGANWRHWQHWQQWQLLLNTDLCQVTSKLCRFLSGLGSVALAGLHADCWGARWLARAQA